jgi:DNA-binding NarL/FixJ family response regulator
LIGRNTELAEIGELLGKPVPIVVRGGPGVGKTALLDELASACRDRGIRTITVELTSAQTWDLFGAQGVLRALRAGFTDIGSSRLATALDTVNQLCTRTTYDSPASRARLLHQLQRLFDSFHGATPSVVLFDDVHADPATVLTTASIALRAGCTVVVACDDEGVALELTSLREAAGQVVELGPLSDQHVTELVAAATRHQPDQAVAPTIRAALGSLAGNPGAVLAICDQLISTERLTYLGGVLCLADPDAPIVLPAKHWLVRLVERTTEFGSRLLALIADSERFSLDDLVVFAATVQGELGACGRAVDEFTAIGALHCTPEGVLTIACPALGAAALDSVGADQLHALHLDFARHLVSGNQNLLALADHLAAGGDTAELDAATLLDRAARRVKPVDPTLAARWQRAALAYRDPADHARLRGELLRELVRIGRYDWLGEVVADTADTSAELAAAACLAALHTGIPIGGAPIVEEWFGANKPFTATELADALAPLGGRRDVPVTPHPGGWYDPIGMIESILGPAYGVPEGGPLVIYRRIVDNYQCGQWDDALSDARTLIATYRATTPIHELAHLLAAEICERRGELDLAENWLGQPDERSAFPTLRSWVEMALPWRRGQADATLEYGWRAYENAVRAAEAGDTAGLHLLITRHALLTMTFGDDDGLAQIQEMATTWHGRYDELELGVTELMVTAIAQNSYPAAKAAAAALRAQGYQAELATACLLAARTADDPRQWLCAADEIVEQLGDIWLRTQIKSLTRTLGVTLPRRTTNARSSAKVEGRIIELIQQGMTNRQIAAAIHVSEKSVERHLTLLFAKTGCRSRLDLVAAYERGVLGGSV